MEVVANQNKKQTKWDQYMRKFEYVKALDAVLAVGQWWMMNDNDNENNQ